MRCRDTETDRTVRACPHPEGDLRARTQARDDDGVSISTTHHDFRCRSRCPLLPSKADIPEPGRYGRFVPKADFTFSSNIHTGSALKPVHGGGAEVREAVLRPQSAVPSEAIVVVVLRGGALPTLVGDASQPRQTAGSTDRRSRKSSRQRSRLLLPRRAWLDLLVNHLTSRLHVEGSIASARFNFLNEPAAFWRTAA